MQNNHHNHSYGHTMRQTAFRAAPAKSPGVMLAMPSCSYTYHPLVIRICLNKPILPEISIKYADKTIR